MTPTVPPMTASAPLPKADLGQQPQDLLLVAADGARRPGERAAVEDSWSPRSSSGAERRGRRALSWRMPR